MSKKKILTIIGIIFCIGSATVFWMFHRPFSRIFSEELLRTWGYTTSSIDAYSHNIRSIKNYSSTNEVFYARFSLSTAKFASEASATKQMHRIQIAAGDQSMTKDYRQVLQHGRTLYFVDPTSNYTRLDHQPHLMALIRRYLDTEGR
jgi:hypothetical protein